MKLRRSPEVVSYFCPGCAAAHSVTLGPDPDRPDGTVWQLTGPADQPTLWPSVLVRRHVWTPPVTDKNLQQWQEKPWPQEKIEHVCHAYIAAGFIGYLDDCTHDLRGQTIPLPDWNPK